MLTVGQYRSRRPLLTIRSMLSSTMPVAGIAVALRAAAASVSATALTASELAGRHAPLHLGLVYLPELGGAILTAFALGIVIDRRQMHYPPLFARVRDRRAASRRRGFHDRAGVRTHLEQFMDGERPAGFPRHCWQRSEHGGAGGRWPRIPPLRDLQAESAAPARTAPLGDRKPLQAGTAAGARTASILIRPRKPGRLEIPA